MLPHFAMGVGVLAAALSLLHTTGVPLGGILEKADWGTVVAAAIGVAGYVIDAQNGRKAEMRAAHVERASNQMSLLLVPLNVSFFSLTSSLAAFLGQHFGEDGEVLSGVDAKQHRERETFLPRHVHDWMFSSVDGIFRVGRNEGRSMVRFFELPGALEASILADPDSSLAVAYRHWVRLEWVPGVKRVAEIIDAGGHLMEVVPQKRLIEFFGPVSPQSNAWDFTPRGLFFSMWLAYARGWEATIARWDENDFSEIRPSVAFPCGLWWIVVEGQTVVGEQQKKLTGQSQMHGSLGHGLGSAK